MELSFLDKKGSKQLKNVLEYLNDPNSIKNPSQKTKMSKPEMRKEFITGAFKHLTEDDRNQLIMYIRHRTNIIDEISNAFMDFKILPEKEDIASFLNNLVRKIDSKKTRLKVFSLIFLNHPPYALDIIYKTKPDEFKKEICKYCISYNPERGYIYALLNNITLDVPDMLDSNKLIDEINYIQSFRESPILEKVFNDYKDLDGLVAETNIKIENNDFQTLYTLAKSIKLLSYYEFNVCKSDLSLLKWAIDITNSNENNIFSREVGKKDLEPYSFEWLVFLAINLLQMDAKKQKLSIIILNHLITKKGFIDKYSDKIGEAINQFIRKHGEIGHEMLEILEKLKVSKEFYNIMNFVYEKRLDLNKNNRLKTCINKKVKDTIEFQWLSNMEKLQKYEKPQMDLNVKLITFILTQKSPKENFNLLKLLGGHNRDLYYGIMEDFEELIAEGVAGSERYIKIIIVLEYQCNNEKVLSKVEQYGKENLENIKAFIESCNPDIIEKYYVENVKKAMNERNDSNDNIINLLQKIEEPQIVNKCSYLILEGLLKNDFNGLINIWEHLTLDIESKIKFKEKILEMVSKKEIEFSKENIAFINEIGIDPLVLYNSMDDRYSRQHLLDIWHRSNEIGKITNVIREEIIINANTLEDLEDVCHILKNYNINDNNIKLSVQIKVYAIVSMNLLKIDVKAEGFTDKLNSLAFLLIDYGLVERFLTDKLLQKEIDKKIVAYLIKKFLDNIQSNKIWEYYWSNVIGDLEDNRSDSDNGNMEIFFNHLAKSKMGIEWFLYTISNTGMDHKIYIKAVEAMLNLLNKQNIAILQKQQEIDQIHEEFLTTVGKTISKALSNMEKTVVSRINDAESDILLENLKELKKIEGCWNWFDGGY